MLSHSEIFTIKQKSDADNPVALFQMFRLYFDGKLVEKNEKTAIPYLIKLANLGPLPCTLSQGLKFTYGDPTDLTGYLLSGYDFILTLIGTWFWHCGYRSEAIFWFKKVLDFADSGLPTNWTKEEKELVKKDCYSYGFWERAVSNLESDIYFDEGQYRDFKLDWENSKKSNPFFLSSAIPENF